MRRARQQVIELAKIRGVAVRRLAVPKPAFHRLPVRVLLRGQVRCPGIFRAELLVEPALPRAELLRDVHEDAGEVDAAPQVFRAGPGQAGEPLGVVGGPGRVGQHPVGLGDLPEPLLRVWLGLVSG